MHEGEFRLAPSERRELRDRLRSRTLPAEDVRRARLILLLAQGQSYLAIRQVLGCNPNYISRWKGRFEAERLAGLYSHHRGRAVEKRTPALEARILEWTRRPAPDGATHLEQPQVGPPLAVFSAPSYLGDTAFACSSAAALGVMEFFSEPCLFLYTNR